MKIYLVVSNMNRDIISVFDTLDKAKEFVEWIERINTNNKQVNWQLNFHIEEWDVK